MKYLFFSVFFFVTSCIYSQNDTVILTETGSYELTPPFPWLTYSSFACLIDRNDQPYLYAANKEFGLGIYDITNGDIVPIDTFLPADFNGLDVSHLKQQGHYLYLAIGDFQSSNHNTGLAILDVSDPQNATITDVWDSTAFQNGASHLIVEGDYAYVSMMNDGLVILNVSTPNNIQFVAQLIPDPNFPTSSAGHHQTRGLKYRNDTIFLAYDRGGLRVIDVSDKTNPTEIYKYINTNLTASAAAAYNDVAIQGNYAFVTVDYCGLEILDISTFPYTTVQWYNPWGCNGFNWLGADLHTNELKIDSIRNLLFFSAGNSEVIVFDISDPINAYKIAQHGSLMDSMGTYGMDLYKNQIALAFIKTPIPFDSDFAGLKLFDWYHAPVRTTKQQPNIDLTIYPNPTHQQINFKFPANFIIEAITIYNFSGQILYQQIGEKSIDVVSFAKGLYIVQVKTDQGIVYRRFMKM